MYFFNAVSPRVPSMAALHDSRVHPKSSRLYETRFKPWSEFALHRQVGLKVTLGTAAFQPNPSTSVQASVVLFIVNPANQLTRKFSCAA